MDHRYGTVGAIQCVRFPPSCPNHLDVRPAMHRMSCLTTTSRGEEGTTSDIVARHPAIPSTTKTGASAHAHNRLTAIPTR